LFTFPRYLILGSALALTACTANTSESTSDTAAEPVTNSGPATVIQVDSADESCTLSAATAPAGTVNFEITNSGSDVTEFYLYAEDGTTVVTELANIAPDLTRTQVIKAQPGNYIAACKPGMTGDGIRRDFTITGEATPDQVSPEIQAALDAYQDYVQKQSATLLAQTRVFANAVKRGDDDKARALYPVARGYWESIETVAESFGDLDPKIDAREADLAPGEKWTGWHRLEKDLWPQRAKSYRPLTNPQRIALADQLVWDTQTLNAEISTLSFTLDQIANGSRGLLEEIASGKVTGEEEYWSRTDLYDMQANLDGARVAYELLAGILETKDPELNQELANRFGDLQETLDQHRRGTGFVGYDQLTTNEVKELATATNALSEPLGELTAALLSES
jgi:iron uptake system component EfeO